jgi:hypothetical protein
MPQEREERRSARGAVNDMLWSAVLNYIFASLQSGDFGPLRKIGLTTQQMQRLASMSLADVMLAIRSGESVVHLRIDADRLDAVMQTVERRRGRDQLIQRCIQLGAPPAMMQQLFDIGGKEFRRLQQRYGVSSPVGRPAHPDPETVEAIYDAWEASGARLTGGELVRIAEETNRPLHTVWREITAHPQLLQRPRRRLQQDVCDLSHPAGA